MRRRVVWWLNVSNFTLKMDVVGPSEALVPIEQATQCHIPNGCLLHTLLSLVLSYRLKQRALLYEYVCSIQDDAVCPMFSTADSEVGY